MNIQQAIKNAIGELAGLTILPRVLNGKTVVFTFHRVLTAQEYNQCHFGRSIVVTDTGLDSFLNHIKRHFHIIALSQLINDLNTETAATGQPEAVITFDDGWRDNLTVGMPILQKHQIPATVFLSTSYVDSPKGFWWQHLGDMLGSPELSNTQSKAINDAIRSATGIRDGFVVNDHAGTDRDLIAGVLAGAFTPGPRCRYTRGPARPRAHRTAA